MQSYITKPKSVKRNEIAGQEWSLSPMIFRFIESKNSNKILLKDLLSQNVKGFEPGSAEYVTFTDNYFIRISEMSDLSFTFDISNDTKKLKPVEGKNAEKFIQKGDICYQTASNVGNVCFYDGEKAFYNSHIRKLDFKDNKYYIFAFLKSQFCKNQVEISGSIKGVDNFREEYLLNTEIIFPTPTSNPNPDALQDLVAVLVQNIIDKEEQIKAKNAEIDRLIETELYGNQKKSSFVYCMPRISEIRREGRLDTGLYTEEFKKIDNVIKSYGGGWFKLSTKNIKTGQTPDDYAYPKKKVNDNVYLWITPRNLNNNILKEKLFIYTKKDNTIQHGDILFGSRGTVGDVFFYDEQQLGKCYINQSTSGIRIDGEIFNKVFVLCYFSSSIFKKIISKYIYDGTVPAITPDILTQFYIPLFPKPLQQQIAKLYYNKIDKNSNLTLQNYLEKEKARNKETGIFQLNMEIFALREKLENLVHKIVMEEKIEVQFE
jgi:restriction endonuclease S subunit